MALNAFAFTGGANVSSIGVTPVAVQVVGPTINITNIGVTTVYGSVGGSASTTLSPVTSITGLSAPAGAAASTASGVGGFAITPGQSLAVPAGGSGTFLWLATLSGVGAVNVANGT